MRLQRRRFLAMAAGAATLPALPRIAWAADYPSRPVHLVVAFPPGHRFDGMNADRRVEREAFDRILLQFARTKAERFLDPKAAEQALGDGGDRLVRR